MNTRVRLFFFGPQAKTTSPKDTHLGVALDIDKGQGVVAFEGVEKNKQRHDNSLHEAGNLSGPGATRLAFGLDTEHQPRGNRSLRL